MALQDVDVQYVWRFLREHNIDLAARKSWCESNDPEFAAKAADVVGLISTRLPRRLFSVSMRAFDPGVGAGARLLEASERTRLDRPQSHDYKRHGTMTLFAALEVATGRIVAEHSKRRRRVEFLGFMNRVSCLPGSRVARRPR